MRTGRRPAAVGLGIALLVQVVASASVAAAVPRSPAGLVSPAGVLPIANNDTGTVIHGRLRSVAAPGVLSNDTQLGGGFTVQLVAGVHNGVLDLDPDGSYTYRSDFSFTGTDSFRYKINGGLLGLSNTANVNLTVTNRAPVTNDDAYTAVADVEKSIGAPGVLANDDDADSDDMTIDILTEPNNGNLNERDDGSFRYKADAGFSGTDSFRYRAWDGVTWSNTAMVRMTVSVLATPRPTAAPTATPTAAPTPVPTPKPTATPRPTALPSIPLPSIPLPSIPLPTLTLPTPTAQATPRVTQRPSATPRPTPTPTPRPSTTAGPSPTPTGSAAPTLSAGPTATPTPPATTEPSDGAVVPPAAGGGTGSDPTSAPSAPPGPGDPFTVPGDEPGVGLNIDATFAAFSGMEWAVPALVLTVPGLLLIIAILAQATIGFAFLPMARRWLGADRRTRRPALAG